LIHGEFIFHNYYFAVRKLIAEFIGAYLLALAVVGSGAMAQTLTHDGALQLLINALVTAAILILIITLFSEISGAHFNPAVTVVMVLKREIAIVEGISYIATQIIAAIAGVITANFFYKNEIIGSVASASPSAISIFSELLATAGLLFLIVHSINQNKGQFLPFGVALWIFGAYFFTPSTSVANPAMTIARTLTNSYAGISTSALLPYVAAQVIGGLLGATLAKGLKTK
jgi:glycerol uptake facilitator-like aquaporin